MHTYDNQPGGTVAQLRNLRRHAPEPERRLLRALREAYPQLKWRHQSPVGGYRPDILCFSERLIIEVDGDTHAGSEAYDANRTRFLESEGYRVLRFGNTDVMQNLDGVIANIALSPREREGAQAKPGKGEGDQRDRTEKGRPGMTRSALTLPRLRGSLPLPMGEGREGLRLFLERHRDVGVGGEPHLAVLDRGDEAQRDVMMMPFMAALTLDDLRARVLLGQLDAVALDMVDGTDMDAVGADDFGMFLDLACIDHGSSPVLVSGAERVPRELVA